MELHIPQRPVHTVTMEHTLKPRYSDEVSATYERLPSDTQMTVRVLDHKGKYREALIGETVIDCGHVQGEQPVYVWLPILPPAQHNYIPFKKPRAPGKPDVAPTLQVSPSVSFCMVRSGTANAVCAFLFDSHNLV